MTRIESGSLGPIQGWAIDRFAPRAMMRFGIASTALGLILFSQITNEATFFLYYFIVSLGAGMGGFMTLTVAVVHWFQRTRSRALGYLMLGFSFGNLLAPLLATVIEDIGWREAALGSGILLFIVGQALATLIVRPSDRGQLPEPPRRPAATPTATPAATSGATSTATPSASAAARPDQPPAFTARQAMRTRAFWALALAHGSPLLLVSSISGFFAVRVAEIDGLTLGHAALAIVIGTICQVFAQLLSGYAGDFISKRLIIAVCLAGHVLAAVVLAFADSFLWVVLAAILHWIAWGGRRPLVSALSADYFGAAHFGKIMGWTSAVLMLFSSSGGLIVGILRDLSGGWAVPFLAVGIGAGTGLIWLALATRPQPPAPPTDADPADQTIPYPQTRS